jgi:conjugative transfer region lipoprotein (TIGR03751 family)
MQKMMLIVMLIWINTGLLSGCAMSTHGDKKVKVFGTDMPSMKRIHDEKFHIADDETLVRPQRSISDKDSREQGEFQWLPNPTLRMYVFKHLTAAGHPVPGYSTFFRLYTRDHIAAPGEHTGWEVK